jgi:hypothetical protein
MKFWIAHPAADSCPVSLARWLKWHISERLLRIAHRWQMDALYPDWRKSDIPF